MENVLAENIILPTSSTMQNLISVNNMSIEWTIIQTGSGGTTIVTNTGHTIIGNNLISQNISATFRTRRVSSSSYITYRIG
jgi:hypothetical protein